MASRKIRLLKEHTTFNVPVRIISEEEARQNILDSLDESTQRAQDSQVDSTRKVEELPVGNRQQSSMGSVRPFDGIAYSGEPIAQHFMFSNLFIDVDGMSFKDQIPIFKNHDPGQIIGYGKLKKSGGKLLIEGKLATSIDEAADVSALADAGFEWELSIGVEPEFIEEVRDGQNISINGMDIVGPATIFRKPNVIETSFVPIGADRKTQAQIFSKSKTKYNKTVEVRNMDEATIKVNGEDVELFSKDNGTFEVTLTLDKVEDQEYTFGCACNDLNKKEEDKKEDFSDELAVLKAENEELKAEIAAYKKDQKKNKFMSAIATSAVKLNEDDFESLSLLPEEKFNAFLAKLENTEVTSTHSEEKATSVDKGLFKQDAPSKFTGLDQSDDPKVWAKRARELQSEYKEKGVDIDLRTAMSKLMTGM